MTRDDALKRLSHLAHQRAFGRHTGSDQLIQACLDALIAGVDSPSRATLAGLLRREEHEAPELFDEVLDGWEEDWSVPIEELQNEAIEAARQLLNGRRAAEPHN